MASSNLTKVEFICEKFSGKPEDYDIFDIRFKSLLHLTGMSETVYDKEDKIKTEPTKNEDETQTAFEARLLLDRENNKTAYSYLITKLPPQAIDLISERAKNNCREALRILNKHYKGESRFCILKLMNNLTSIQMGNVETVSEYVIRAEKYRTRLQGCGESISNTLLIHFLIQGLPKNKGFEGFTTMLCGIDVSKMSVDKFRSSLNDFIETKKVMDTNSGYELHMSKYGRRQQGSPKSSDNERSENNKYGRYNMKCYNCGLPGHISRYCSVNNDKKDKKRCTNCNVNNHSTDECWYKNKKTHQIKSNKYDSEEENDDTFLHTFLHAMHNDDHDYLMSVGNLTEEGYDVSFSQNGAETTTQRSLISPEKKSTPPEGEVDEGQGHEVQVDEGQEDAEGTKSSANLGKYDQELESYISLFTHEHLNSVNSVPTIYKNAISCDKSEKWHEAMKNKYSSLLENETFEVVDRPNHRVLDGRCIYDMKGDGKSKERLIAKGLKRIQNIDYG